MSALELRSDEFEKYGAAAYFDKERTLTKIFWSHGNRMVFPGDQGWEHAKCKSA